MNLTNLTWTTRKYEELLSEEKVSFDYPIQRKGGQWDNKKASLLIRSMLSGYPIPPLYVIMESVTKHNTEGEEYTDETFQVLDGKQRLTNIQDFLANQMALHDDTPEVYDSKKNLVSIAGNTFSELPKALQNKIMDYTFTVYKLENATDEEIEDVFFYLQNGTPLSAQQQAKATMGNVEAEKFKKFMEHKALTINAPFTKNQLVKADDEVAVVQTMMLLDEDHELKSIASSEVAKYTMAWKGNVEKRNEILDKIGQALDYINEAFEDKSAGVILRKVNFPMAIITAMRAIEKEVAPVRFKDWAGEFALSLKKDVEKGKFLDALDTDYKSHGGEGSVKAHKTKGRVESMLAHFELYMTPKTDVVIDLGDKDDLKELENAVTSIQENLGNKKEETVVVEVEDTVVEEKNELPPLEVEVITVTDAPKEETTKEEEEVVVEVEKKEKKRKPRSKKTTQEEVTIELA